MEKEYLKQITAALGNDPDAFILMYRNSDGIGACAFGNTCDQMALVTYANSVFAPYVFKKMSTSFEENYVSKSAPPVETL